MNTNRNTAMIMDVSTRQAPMSSLRKTALVAGLLYLLSFVSIPTLALYGAIHEANYIVGPGTDNAVIFGGTLEIIVALAGIGTAVALYPVLRKQNEGVALGLVMSRVLEACTIFIGVAFLLSVVSLRQAGAGADALITSHTLVTLYDRIFLLGQSFMPAVMACYLHLCCISLVWYRGFFPLSDSSERACSSPVISQYCLGLLSSMPLQQPWLQFRLRSGSSRSVFSW